MERVEQPVLDGAADRSRDFHRQAIDSGPRSLRMKARFQVAIARSAAMFGVGTHPLKRSVFMSHGHMSHRQTIIAVVVSAALGAPALASARDFDFRYIEGGIVGGFVNDIETSGAVTGNVPLELESDADGGAFIGGALQFGNNVHVFGEYASMGQELEVRSGTTTVDGEWDVVRWRVGVGYRVPFSETAAFYGRLSLDQLELKDAQAAGFDLDIDADDSGIGTEVGVIWAATPTVHLQGHVRYTAVGEIASSGSDPFDSDILVGVNGRWHFRPNFALVTGYEYGKITTVNVGLRYTF